MYINLYPDKLTAELAEAERLRIEPIKVDDSRFQKIANLGTFKWAVDISGELWVMPKDIDDVELKHPVLTGGGPVLAAGEADVSASESIIVGIFINNESGHYQPNLESLVIGRQMFAKYGITFP